MATGVLLVTTTCEHDSTLVSLKKVCDFSNFLEGIYYSFLNKLLYCLKFPFYNFPYKNNKFKILFIYNNLNKMSDEDSND
jgi:hypothetical protein